MADVVRTIGLGELFALSASFTYAITLVCLRQGLRSGSPLTAILFSSFFIATVSLAVTYMRGSLRASTFAPLFWFFLAGAVGQGLGNLNSFIGIERLGVSRSATIASSAPLWGAFFAVLVLGERPGAAILGGTVLIVAGVGLLATAEEPGRRGLRGWRQGGLLFPLAASLSFASIPIFNKLAFAHQKTPVVGVGVSFAAAGVTLLLGGLLLPAKGNFRVDRRALFWFGLAASGHLVSSILLALAYMIGNVTTTLPLGRLAPLWVLLLSYFFLGELERINWRVVLAAALVVGGGVLITVFR